MNCRSRHRFELLAATIISIICVAPAAAGDWPQWRGPSRTGRATPEGVVPDQLSADLKPIWKIPIGGGFSAPVVAQNRLVYLDEQDGNEVAHALDTGSGQEIWRVPYAESFGDEWGAGPRSTPIIDGDRLYVQACNGEFRCLALVNGQEIWRTSFGKFGATFLGSKAGEGTARRRGNNGSGVIDGDRLILPVGGTNGASLVCFDKLTGKVLWSEGNDEAAYSSPMVATLAGVRQVVAFTADALLGADLATGRILWRVPLKTAAKRHAATPVIRDDTVTVNSHTFGTICLQITRAGGAWEATELWSNRPMKVNIASYVLVDDHLYSFGPNRNFVCLEAQTGVLKWSKDGMGRGKKDYASTIAVGNRLLVLTEAGTLLLLEARADQYSELGRLQACGDTWSHPAYARGRIFVRDQRSLQCLELAKTTGN